MGLRGGGKDHVRQRIRKVAKVECRWPPKAIAMASYEKRRTVSTVEGWKEGVEERGIGKEIC